MNKPTKSTKPILSSFNSTQQNPPNSPKKQFPSISLTRHLEQYKAYRGIENKKKHLDADKSTPFDMSLEQKSFSLLKHGQMPSIHNANQISSFEGILQASEQKVQKQQIKIMKCLLSTRRQQEWRLYMTKSQLIEKSQEFEQIEEYLLKFISRCIQKTQSNTENTLLVVQNQLPAGQQATSFIADKKANELLSQTGIQATRFVSKKSSQPSLSVLRQQLNTVPNTKESSLLQNSVMNNKTSQNWRSDTRQQKYLEEINKMTFQRGLIQKKLQLFQARISQLQNRLIQQNIPIDQSNLQQQKTNHPSKKTTPTQELLLSNIITQNKYKSQVEFKKIQNQTLHKQIAIIKDFSFKIKMQNERLLKQLETLQKECQQCREFKKYKQLWLMQCEEAIGWKGMWKDRRDETNRLNNKLKILKEKNKQLLHSFNFAMVVHPDQEEDKQELENIIKSFQDWLKVMSIPRVNCPTIDPKSLLQDMTIKEQQCMPDPDNFNYQLLKPNFFIFFEAYQKTIMMEKNILNTRPLQPAFYVKIRGILDSMYNHFNSYGEYKHWTAFPEFVIGFLQKYEISYTTMKLQPRKKPMSSEEKLTFLMNLFNKKLSNTWECDMFRSFILEEYTLDQIYFFLDCRNDLNGGSALTHGFGTIDPVSYVKLSKALATTQRKLSPYQNYIIERVKTIIKSRKIQKNGETFIDRHFVLKLLLQVYSLQKLKSQKIFQASFKTKNSKKSTISYSDYFSFMSKNFQFLTTVQICELYRETYSLTSGKLTHKAVHYVCSSRGLFIPLIWSKRLNMNVLQKSLNNDMILLDLQNSTRKMESHLSQFGVEDVAKLENQLNYFLRQLDWYRNNRQVFFFKLQEIKKKIIKANCLLEWQSTTYTPNQMLSSEEIRNGIMQIHTLIHYSDSSTKLLTAKKEEKEKALKQITHNFKVRIQQSMRQFKRVDDDQLRKLKEQMAIEIKLREIRHRQEEKEKQYEEEKSQQNQANPIGNSFMNVNQMVIEKNNEKKKKVSRMNLHKEQIVQENNQESQKQIQPEK